MPDFDRTASIMSPAKLAQVQPAAPVSPAARLDQMPLDVGQANIERLAQLGREISAAAAGRDDSELAGAIAALAQALPRIDFELLQARGWWARTTGKSRSAGAEFAARYEEAAQAATDLVSLLLAQLKRLQAESGAAERHQVEMEVETTALEKSIEQGARWLHDMRGQLKARQAEAADEAAQQKLREEAARCELLVVRFKLLRACSNAAKDARAQAQAAAQRRAGLLQSLQQAQGAQIKNWRARLSVLANAARDDQSPALTLEEPAEVQRDLERCLRELTAECGQLQAQEQALAASLSAMSVQLASAA